ncbi:hypothetical protein OSTOST_25865 [Ostertagia ostertagi]
MRMYRYPTRPQMRRSNHVSRHFKFPEAVVNQLLQNLQGIQPESSKIADQINTLDKILSIISQLERKGENTDTQQMRRTILKKFTDKIQRAMLKKKTSSQGSSWTTKQLLQDLQEVFEIEAQFRTFEEP